MGISSFVKFLFTYQQPNKNLAIKPKGIYFDLNSLMHDVASLVYAYGDNKNRYDNDQVEYYKKNTNQLDQLYLTELTKHIDDIISSVGFTDFVWIGIDGVAPIAKIQQQRWRRYKSKIESPFGFSSVMLSPGTEFMEKVDDHLKKWKTDKIVYNDTTSHKSPGEAEHKIFKDIMNKTGDFVVYGLDNDLVILSLMHTRQGLNIFNMKKEIETKEYYFVDISRLKTSILSSMGSKSTIDDFVLLSFFIGNDFIPAIFRYNLDSSQTLNFLIHLYGSFSSNMKPIISENELSWKRFEEYLKHVERNEMTIYKPDDPHSVIKKNNKNDLTMDFIKNTYEAYVGETYEQVNHLTSNLLQEMSNAWFKIVHWNFGYYKEKLVSNDTFYPYYHAPMISFLTSNFPSKLERQHIYAFNYTPTPFLNVNVQMACILPPSYIGLVQDKKMFKKIIKDFPFWFPSHVELDRDGLTEKNIYMEKILLPFIQPSMLKDYISQPGLLKTVMSSAYKDRAVNLLKKFGWDESFVLDSDEQSFVKMSKSISKHDEYGGNSNRGEKRAKDILEIITNMTCKKPNISRYLDIGCNTGENTLQVKKVLNLKSADCIDLESFSGKKIIPVKGINFKFYDGKNIPYDDASFDLVTILQVLHHVRDLDHFMLELTRIVKNGGVVILREHDSLDTQFESLIDFEHFLWAVKDGVTYKDFTREHFAKYFSKSQLIELFAKYGFKYCNSIKKHETSFGLVNYYYAQFVKQEDMYKGSLLHVHYSAMVKTSTLLNYLYEMYPNNLYWNYKTRTLSFSNKSTLSERDKSDIQKYIQSQWKSSSFDTIGNLFFDIIKNIDFYPSYIHLVEKEMIEQNIDHVELRLKLGSMFRRTLTSKGWSNVKLSIENEINVLFNLQQEMLKRNKSFVIIAQSSKHYQQIDVAKYFYEITQICTKNPKFKQLIVAFDIVGDETKGKILSEYESYLEEYELIPNGIIPFVFHAGEVDNDNSVHNIDFALQYGFNRIGHGIYSMKDDQLVQTIKKNKILLEFCPLSMVHLGNMKQDTIKNLLESGMKFCINSDDPNKIFDYDLNSNFEYMEKNGLSFDQFSECVLNSITFSFANENIRSIMLKKHKDYFG